MKKIFSKIGKSEIRNSIAVMYVCGVLSFLFVICFKPVPPENKDLVNILGGNIIAGVGIILSFFFGTSKTETDKTTNDAE